MYEKLKELYRHGRITEEGLRNAVNKGWITEAEMETILRENYFEIGQKA